MMIDFTLLLIQISVVRRIFLFVLLLSHHQASVVQSQMVRSLSPNRCPRTSMIRRESDIIGTLSVNNQCCEK